MTFVFEELDHQQTPLGEICLRRRSEPRFGAELIYEVMLGEEYLMSSRFTAAEVELARLALGELEGNDLDVLVGGLGLGYTAAAALEHPSVGRLAVIELMAPVIDWHRRGLVPLGGVLTSDPRCELVHADFFELARSPGGGFDRSDPERRFDAVLLDIDHSPRHWLDAKNAGFYTAEGLGSLAARLRAGGVFGLWSNDPPDAGFERLLASVFRRSRSHVVSFPNPYTDAESSNTVYLTRVR